MMNKKYLEDFEDWINTWANFDEKHNAVTNNKITDYGRGYKDGIYDVYKRIQAYKKQTQVFTRRNTCND